MSFDRIALVQFDVSIGPATDGTIGRIRSKITRIGPDVDLVVFPELATTGYTVFEQARSIAEPVPGPTTEAVGEAAAAADTNVLLGMAVSDDTGALRNALVWIDRDGDVALQYDKRNLWGRERETFTPGDDVAVLDCDTTRIGVQICYDLNFPAFSAALARSEIDVLVNCSAWSVPMVGDWNRLPPARAVELGAYVCGCNRAGTEPDLEFCGRTVVHNPDGSERSRLGEDPGTTIVELDPDVLAAERARNPMREERRDRPSSVRTIRIE